MRRLRLHWPFAWRSTVDYLRHELEKARTNRAEAEKERDSALRIKHGAVEQLLTSVHAMAQREIQREMPGIANLNPACRHCDVAKAYIDEGLIQ